MNILLIDYSAGNTKSITNAFKKIGVAVDLSSDPRDLKNADGVVLPGVGNYGSAMQRLEKFKTPLRDYVDDGGLFLGVCLGIQIILEESSEAPGVAGFGLLEGSSHKFQPDEKHKVPHMGWNTIEKTRDTPILEGIESGDYFYFVHSFYPQPVDQSAVAAKTE